MSGGHRLLDDVARELDDEDEDVRFGHRRRPTDRAGRRLDRRPGPVFTHVPVVGVAVTPAAIIGVDSTVAVGIGVTVAVTIAASVAVGRSR
jgi:ribosomal protein S12 methylthiotransferase accessory factor YcaO